MKATVRIVLFGLLAGVCLLAAGCGSQDQDATSPPQTTTMVSISTTVAPPTTAAASTTESSAHTTTPGTTPTTPPTTTFPDVGDRVPTLLLSSDEGIDIVGPSSSVEVLADRSIAIALSDLRGGVVFQRVDLVEERTWPPTPVPIEWIQEMGTDPIVVVDGSGANRQRLVQVAWIEDKPQILYRKRVVRDIEDETEYLVMLDPDSGDERILGIIGGYESDDVSLRIGGDAVAVASSEYAGGTTCAVLLDLDRLLVNPTEGWIPQLCHDDCPLISPLDGPSAWKPEKPGRMCPDWTSEPIETSIKAGFSHDASSVVIARSFDGNLDISLVGVRTGDEVWNSRITIGDYEHAVAVEYGESQVLLMLRAFPPSGEEESARAILIAGENQATIDDIRYASFWLPGPLGD